MGGQKKGENQNKTRQDKEKDGMAKERGEKEQYKNKRIGGQKREKKGDGGMNTE